MARTDEYNGFRRGDAVRFRATPGDSRVGQVVTIKELYTDGSFNYSIAGTGLHYGGWLSDVERITIPQPGNVGVGGEVDAETKLKMIRNILDGKTVVYKLKVAGISPMTEGALIVDSLLIGGSLT